MNELMRIIKCFLFCMEGIKGSLPHFFWRTHTYTHSGDGNVDDGGGGVGQHQARCFGESHSFVEGSLLQVPPLAYWAVMANIQPRPLLIRVDVSMS